MLDSINPSLRNQVPTEPVETLQSTFLDQEVGLSEEFGPAKSLNDERVESVDAEYVPGSSAQELRLKSLRGRSDAIRADVLSEMLDSQTEGAKALRKARANEAAKFLIAREAKASDPAPGSVTESTTPLFTDSSSQGNTGLLTPMPKIDRVKIFFHL
jgi:hypothetical protein